MMNLQPVRNEQPLVTIIVRTHGQRGSFLRECLQSIVDQDYRPLEINVIEDGSSRSKAIVTEFYDLREIDVNYSSIPAGGRCRAGNAGLMAASGTWINFLDDDDQLLPSHVRSLIEKATSNADLKGVYARSLKVPTEVHSLKPLDYTELPPLESPGRPFSRWDLWESTPFPIQACLFHRDLFERYGGFDPDLDKLEDWHLWLRYFSNEPIDRIEEFTSFYRIPADTEAAVQRDESFREYYPCIVKLRQEIDVSVTGTELQNVANQRLRMALVPKILALADHEETNPLLVRTVLAGIRSARFCWIRLRGCFQRKDPAVTRFLRDHYNHKNDRACSMSVEDAMSVIPEVQSREDLANYWLFQRLLQRVGRLNSQQTK